MATKFRAPQAGAHREKKHPSVLHQSHVKKNYGFLAFLFTGGVIVVSFLVAYFAFTKTTIILTPRPQNVSVEFSLNLSDISGTVQVQTGEKEKSTEDLPSVREEDGYASGTVIVVNNYSADQPLVETTRLLSTEGILFRTQKSVTVPSGGSVEVEVRADQPGISGDIGPSKFEIVALWSGLKDKIYAESSESMTQGKKIVRVVSQEDIDTLANALEEEIMAESGEGAKIDILEKTSSAQPNDEVERLTVKTQYRLTLPNYDVNALLEIAETKLQEKVSSDYALLGVKKGRDIQTQLASYNIENNTGALDILYTGKAIINTGFDAIDPQKLTNKSETALQTYLESLEGVENAEIDFSPFWLKRTPPLQNRIKIKILTK